MNKTRHRKLERVKGDVLIIGVDIARSAHKAALRLPQGEVSKIFSFANDLSGFQRLAQQVKEQCEKHSLRGAVLGIEPTGHYWEALAYWWEDNYGTVVMVNPMHTKRAKELEDNSPLKSDSKDARVIADLVAQGKYLECHMPKGVFAELRNLVSQRERYQQQRTQVINQLHQCVDRIFPELATEFSSIRVKSYRQLLANYPQPEQLAALAVEELTALLRKCSRGSLGQQKAERLIALAGRSIGVKEAASTIGAEVKRLTRQLDLIEMECSDLEVQMEHCLERTPGAGLLRTVHGFGIITVAGILANTGDIAEYEHPEELIKLAGLNLFEISSGKHRGKLRISKRGRAQLRKILYMAAVRATRSGNPFRLYYRQLVDRGVNPTASLVALMRKLLRVIWSIIRNSQAFDAQRLDAPQAQKRAA